MLKNIIFICGFGIATLVFINLFPRDALYNLKLEALKQKYSAKSVPSVDHGKLDELKGNFQSPQDVTRACISCHTERHREIMASSHWNWERVAYVKGRGIASMGKKNILNNFCIGAKTNEQACAKCHIGFGMNSDEFDFNNAVNVDCMVCHDNSEEYLKGSARAGYPDRTVNLTKVAQSVGAPKKSNCGACHFYGGGGNNVKHGDLEEALLACDRTVDVHMAQNGLDLACVACHTAENHVMLGKLYSVSSENINRATCEQCHTSLPHFDAMLNRHSSRVACQTCHIPLYAKAHATKMSWKWSKAGVLKDGKAYHQEDSDGNHTYLSAKGTFRWEKNVIPGYTWFDGTADHYLLGDTIRSVPVQMNTLHGAHNESGSRIIPVKIHTGDQIYDKQHNYLVQPKLYGAEQGDSAYWKSFTWSMAAEAGMGRVGLPFSGEYGFVETEMYWPLNHMVAPREQALQCGECHRRNKGRLWKLQGFYLPGRDRNAFIDGIGLFMIVSSLLGVAVHGLLRIVFAVRRK